MLLYEIKITFSLFILHFSCLYCHGLLLLYIFPAYCLNIVQYANLFANMQRCPRSPFSEWCEVSLSLSNRYLNKWYFCWLYLFFWLFSNRFGIFCVKNMASVWKPWRNSNLVCASVRWQHNTVKTKPDKE